MIVEWGLSFFLIWFFPSSFIYFNPFFLPLSTLIFKRKPFLACTGAYAIGLIRDIFLASPRLGLFGLSSLFSSLLSIGLCIYLPLEGMGGSLALTAILTLCDTICMALGVAFFCRHFFFSWNTLFVALLFSSLWTFFLKGIPFLVNHFSLKRRRRDSDS